MTLFFSRRVLIAYILIGFFFFQLSAKAQSPWPAGAGTEIAAGILPFLPNFEASGIIYHPLLNQLLVVSDDGNICKMDTDGSSVSCFNVGALDLEGISLTSADSPFAYLGVEFPYRILELDLANEVLSGNFWDVPGMSGPVNAGIEAITFIPNGFHPYANSNSGGLFYLGLQDTGEIFVYDVDLSQSGQIALIDQFTPVLGRTDIADLFFLEETETLYALYDAANIVAEMHSDGSIIQEYVAAGVDQEGLALIANCDENTAFVYIAEDSGPAAGPHVLAFENYPLNCPPSEEEEGNDDEEESEPDPPATPEDPANDGEDGGSEENPENPVNTNIGSGGCSLILRDDKASPSKSRMLDKVVLRK